MILNDYGQMIQIRKVEKLALTRFDYIINSNSSLFLLLLQLMLNQAGALFLMK
jgi:hypothetical protein